MQQKIRIGKRRSQWHGGAAGGWNALTILKHSHSLLRFFCICIIGMIDARVDKSLHFLSITFFRRSRRISKVFLKKNLKKGRGIGHISNDFYPASYFRTPGNEKPDLSPSNSQWYFALQLLKMIEQMVLILLYRRTKVYTISVPFVRPMFTRYFSILADSRDKFPSYVASVVFAQQGLLLKESLLSRFVLRVLISISLCSVDRHQ